MTITIAPKGNPAPADVRLDGTTDITVLAKYVTRPGADIRILAGTVNLNGGSSGDPSGGGYLRPGEGTTITGEPGTVLAAPNNIVRITVDKPGVILRQMSLKGKGHIQWFDSGFDSLLEDVSVDQSDGAGGYLDLKKNCTAAFLFYARKGKTLRNVTLRRCTAIRSYHHGFSMHVYSYQEGSTFENFLFEDCRAISCGSGLLSPRDWSTGFNTADTGNVRDVVLRRCIAIDAYQSGFHCDGNWAGHAQTVTGLVYDRCVAERCGQRCSPNEQERFCSGFYGQSATYIDCRSIECALAGFGVKNEVPKSLRITGCSDVGSKYGLICEYAAKDAEIDFRSERAKVRAFQGQVTGAGTLDLSLVDPPTPAVTLGRTARIDYFDCPGHAAVVRNKYDKLGYTIYGTQIVVRAKQRPVVEVWPSSRLVGDWQYLPLDVCAPPPAEPPTPDLPNPVPQGSLYTEDGGWIWYQPPEGRPAQLMVGESGVRIPPEYFAAGGVTLRAQYGAVKIGANGYPEHVVGWLPDEIRIFYRDVQGDQQECYR
ncbi:MAG TPA: hypothetical protein PLY91_10015 [Methanoregulaceae archaeon]|nr:hypothetical protein [Methanoregulaceae archaeon]